MTLASATLLSRLRGRLDPLRLVQRARRALAAQRAQVLGGASISVLPDPPQRTDAEGLVRLDVRLVLPPAAASSGALWIDARSDDGAQQARFDLSAADLRRGQLHLALVSPLLRDGARRLQFTLGRQVAQAVGSPPGAATAGTPGEEVLARSAVSLTVRNPSALAGRVRAALQARATPWLLAGDLDSALWPYDQAPLTPWFDRPDAQAHIDALAATGRIDARERAWLEQFVRDGFIVAEGLIDESTIAAVNAELDAAVRSGFGGYRYGSSERIRHLHLHYPAVRALWQDARWLRLVDLIFDARALPCQTLTYLFGSEQDAHQDTIHLTPFPAGMMCGTWIALQDIEPDSGELVVYPGSHRETRLTMRDCDCAKVHDDAAPGAWAEFGAKVVPRWAAMAARYEPVVYRPKKGTVLIWHENLLHAGSPRIDKARERRSIVIHSFAEGALAYYDSSGSVGATLPAAERLA